MRHVNLFIAALFLNATIVQAVPIQVTPLQNIESDSVGLISAQLAEIPFDFWRDTSVEQAKTAFESNETHRLPALRAFMLRLSLAELAAPIKSTSSNDFILTRIDYLLDHGALDQANALLDKIGPKNAALFARWFDTKLLLRRLKEACAPLINTAHLSNNKQEQVYCLAQNNRWFDAALVLDGASALDDLHPYRVELLNAYLDPESAVIEEQSFPLKQFSVLDYILHEALFLPVPALSQNDLRFGHDRMSDQFGWRNQIHAAERLARQGVIPTEVINEIYTHATPAASGGVWERVRLWQKLNQAFFQTDETVLCLALQSAWEIFRQHRLEGVFARHFAQRLALRHVPDACINAQMNVLVFAPNYASLLFDLPLSLSIRDPRRELLQTGQIITASNDPYITAIRRGLHPNFKEQSNSSRLLRALSHIRTGIDSAPHAIETALHELRANGLGNLARQVALQLLVMRLSL